MSKYYTPDITEFHVGFEYEFHGMSIGGFIIADFNKEPPITANRAEPTIKVWSKEKLFIDEFNIISRSLNSLDNLIKSNQIRVKYLDREDIESLGFNTEDEGDCYNKTHKFTLYGLYPWASLTGINHQYKITIDGNQVFHGVIKNKSELKRILKQLNIGLYKTR